MVKSIGSSAGGAALEGEIVDDRAGPPAVPGGRGWLTQAERDRVIDQPEEVLRRIRGALAERTWEEYRKQWTRYLRWCQATRRTPLPATLETILSYLQSMAHDNGGRGLAIGTVRQALAAIRRFHGYGNPAPDWVGGHQAVADWLRDYEKERNRTNRGPQRAAGARRVIMRALLDATPTTAAYGVRDRAVLLLGYYMAARRSELANLTFADIRYTVDGLEICIRYSKTDQLGTEAPWVPIPANDVDPTYCPVLALQEWVAKCEEVGITDGVLFRPIDRNGNIRNHREPMSGTAFEGVMARAVAAAQLEAERRKRDRKLPAKERQMAATLVGLLGGKLTPHSLRRGFATDARASLWDLLDIARHGRWSPQSKSIHIYIEEVDKWLRHHNKPVRL